MQTFNHYELAFEAFLREKRIPFLAVEERLRNQLASGEKIKSLDFVISRPERSFLIDVKGRKFPSGTRGGGFWRQWSTRDDLRGIRQWELLFGEQFVGLFVFAFQISGPFSPLPPGRLFAFRKRTYAFVGISLADYISDLRLVSQRWQTFALPTEKFRKLAKPFEDFL